MTWLILIVCCGIIGYLIYSKSTRRVISRVPITDKHRKLIIGLIDKCNSNELNLSSQQQQLLDYAVRNSTDNEVYLTEKQRTLLLHTIEAGLAGIEDERQEMINQAAKVVEKVPLTVLLEKIEQDRDEHLDDAEYVVEMDRQISELKEKYGTHIGVDELYKLYRDYEEEHGNIDTRGENER